MIILPGQGKPLPADCSYKGEWLVENRMFLYRPTNQTSLGTGTPEMTAGFKAPDGETCFGINSMELAWALRLGSDEIFRANQNGTLMLERVEDAIPTHGATGAKRYIFRYGEMTAGITVEWGAPGGTA